MKYHVVVVESDATLLHGIVCELSLSPSLHVSAFARAEDVIELLDAEPPDLLLTAMDLPGLDGTALLQTLQERAFAIPTFVMIASPATDSQALVEFPDVQIIEKPIVLTTLRRLLEDRLTSHAGPTPMGPFQISDYLQLAGIGRHSLRFQVSLSMHERGVIEIVKGDVWNVTVGERSGKEALSHLMRTPIQTFGFTVIDDIPRNRQIHAHWEELLLDLARLEDELNWGGKIPERRVEDSADQLDVPSGLFEAVSESEDVSETTQQKGAAWLEVLRELDSDTTPSSMDMAITPPPSMPGAGFASETCTELQQFQLSAAAKEQLRPFFEQILATKSIQSAWIADRHASFVEGRSNSEEHSIAQEEVVRVLTQGAEKVDGAVQHLAFGELRQATFEFRDGLMLLMPVNANVVLVIVADKGASLGLIRFQVKEALIPHLSLFDALSQQKQLQL